MREPAAGAVTVRAVQPSDRPRWNEFVFAHPEGTFFHRVEWVDVLRRAFGHPARYLLAERDGEICGVLPLAHLKSLIFGNSLISTPFCVYGGILASDASAFQALEQEACTLARTLGVQYLEMRNRQRLHPDWPCKDLYVTFRKEIQPQSEANLSAIPRKQRAMVRKGIQKGLVAEVDKTPERHYALYSQSVRNLGTPVFARKYLEVLCEVFGSDCEIRTVVSEGNAVASVLSFYFRDEVLPYYGGGSSAARPVAGNDFMYWAVMEAARERGCKTFDYGRSKRGTGAFEFKEHWGFEPQPLFYEYYLVKANSMPNLSPTNPKYQRAIALWQRLPLPLTQLIGPAAARWLG